MRTSLLRRIGQTLWWGGLALVLAGISLLLIAPSASPVPPVGLIGLGIAAIGLNVLLLGDITPGAAPKSFSARGQAVRGLLHVRAGLADLEVDAGSNDRIAQVRFGPLGKPAFEVSDGVARLLLKNPPLRPNIAEWEGHLARNVLWDVDVRSSLGHMRVDLRELRLESVQAATSLGRIHVTPSQRGYVYLDLHTAAGEIELSIPADVGAQITIQRGPLATVTSHNERLLAPAPHQFVTANYETAAAQADVRIVTRAGHIYLTASPEK